MISQYQPEILVYVADQSDLELLHAGATACILDMPLLSITARKGPQNLDELKQLRALLGDCVTVYLQCDLICHTADFERIEPYLEWGLENTQGIRVQDMGLYAFCQQRYSHIPDLASKFQIISGTRHSNSRGIAALEKMGFSRVQLNNEWSLEMIQALQTQTQIDLEILAHGPLLIQYSYRRYLQGYTGETESVFKQAEDLELPGRQFYFLDNEHGHMMFAHFDRALLMQMEAVMALRLKSLLIDTRFSKNPIQVLDAYTKAIDERSNGKDGKSESLMTDFLAIKHTEQRPLKPGFFLANQSDQDWRDYRSEGPIQIIDARKGEYVLLESIDLIAEGQYLMSAPTGKQSEVSLENLRVIRQEQPFLYQAAWKKGMMQSAHLNPK